MSRAVTMRAGAAAHRSGAKRGRTCAVVSLVVLVAGGVVSGCAGAAAAETHDRVGTVGAVGAVAVPEASADGSRTAAPGVTAAPPPDRGPAALAPPAGLVSLQPRDNPRAEWTLAAVTAQFEDAMTAPKAPDRVALAPDREHEALGHYLAGRDEALRGRHLVAITRLEQARAIDPASPAILRQLARSYGAIGNTQQAIEMFEAVLRVEPADAEARFTLGFAALRRGADEEAVARLLGHFDHDVAADLLASAGVHQALARLGYDRAAIEEGMPAATADLAIDPATFYHQRVMALLGERGVLCRSIGDAYVRLGEFPAALEAYEAAAMLLAPRALDARLVYAHLGRGRPDRAAAVVLESIETRAPEVDDRLVALCAYLREQGPVAAPAGAIEELGRRYADRPSVQRAIAALEGPRAGARRLERALAANPRAVRVAGDRLRLLGAEDPRAAVDLTARLAEGNPDLTADLVGRLIVAVPDPIGTLNPDDVPPTPGHALIGASLLGRAAELGAAWDLTTRALARWPDHAALRLMRVELAGRLDEPGLLDDALADAADVEGAWAWLVRARALREVGELDRAVVAAKELDPAGSFGVEALLARAQVLLARAEDAPNDAEAGAALEAATDLARRAIARDPRADDPYRFLVTLHGAPGPAADPRRLRGVIEALRSANPSSPVLVRLEAEEALQRGRYTKACELAIGQFEADRLAEDCLNVGVLAWQQLRGLPEVEAWLRGQLDEGGAYIILEQLARVLLADGRADEAVRLLAPRADGGDPVARRLLEMAYQLVGDPEAALRLAEPRLRRRPEGTRRALQLAMTYAQSDRRDDAVAQLRWLAEHAGAASRRHLMAAVGLAARLDDADGAAQGLTADLVAVAASRFEAVPLPIYGAGLRALAGQPGRVARLRALASRAASAAQGADDRSLEAVLPWRDVAQGLVDEGHPWAAAVVLRARLAALDGAAPPLAPEVRSLLVSMILTAQSVDPGGAELAIGLLGKLDDRGVVPALPGMEGAPTLVEALTAASQLFSLVGNEAGSEQLLLASIELQPDASMALNNIGYMRIERGAPDEQTVAWIEEAGALDPDEATILDTVGWLRYKQGRLEDRGEEAGALTLIRRAMEAIDEPSAEVLDHYGDALWRAGRPGEAIEHWRTAEELLADPERRREMIRNYLLLQSQVWGLLVADPRELYDRDNGRRLERLQRKLAEAEQGGRPPVEPTFVELMDAE